MAHKRNLSRADGGEGGREKSENRDSPARTRKTVVALGFLLAVAAGAWVGAVFRPGASHAVSQHARRALQNHRNFEGRRGPWGLIEYSRIAISMPIEYAPGDTDPRPARWWFRGATREGVESLLVEAGLGPAQLRSLEAGAWEVSLQGVILTPPRQILVDLTPAARGRIYGLLAADERNSAQHTPEIFYPQYLDERLESSGLPDQTVGLIRGLLYPRKDWMLFSDANLVLDTLHTAQERQRFHQMVHRRMTLMAQIMIDSTSDIDAMLAYWDFKGRSKGLRSLFESLARVPGGGELDISHVLTQFARQRLYTFPDPSDDPEVNRRDCGWTALNFFNEQPDDRLSHPEFAAGVLANEYERVTEPRFGDVAALIDEKDESVHLATYLAENLTFTKNGHNYTQPWTLMKLEDLVEQYSINSAKPLDVWYMRRKR